MSQVPWQRFFDSSPAIHLLRSPNAAWILDFLHQQFKLSEQITQPHSALLTQLETHLTTVGILPAAGSESAGAETAKRNKAESYLSTWCAAECRWLKRFIDDHQPEPLYQLTAETELVLAFVLKGAGQTANLAPRSHLRSILGLLDEVSHTSESHQLDPSLAREQFSLAVSQLEQLKSEFRGVEERFKSITRGVQHRLLTADQPRGEILEFALDAEELLKNGEHGQSFFEFLKLVHDPDSQERIAQLVQRLMQLETLTDRHDELQSLRTMIPTLLKEAEKILRTTQHLSQALRRLLDARSTRHHLQLARVLRDIRGQAARLAAAPPIDISLEIEVDLDIQVPFDRPFWSQAEPFAEVTLQLTESDPVEHALALEQLVALERIDWQAMRRNVARATKRMNAITLLDLLEQFPIRTGAVELLGYLQIAYEDGHSIDPSRTVELRADWEGGRGRTLRLPEVIFKGPDQRKKLMGKKNTSGADADDADTLHSLADSSPTSRAPTSRESEKSATSGGELK